ncbi:MAG TPA: hypothetical protein VGJ36_09745 [Gemmatimonadales bacterium]
MFGSEILDVAIGLIFVYLLISLVCTAIREIVEAWFKTRAVLLEAGIRDLLKDKKGEGLVQRLYTHPLVYGLFRGEYDAKKVSTRKWYQTTNLPTYIPAGNFAVALMDLAVRGQDAGDKANAAADAPKISLETVRSSIAKLDQPQVQRALLSAIDMAEGQLAQAQRNVEAWYDSAMDRVAGRYKRRTQWYVFLLGVVIAAWANVNTFTLARYLYRDEGARSALVASAGGVARDSAIQTEGLPGLLGRVEKLELPIGWRYGVSGVRPGEPSPQHGLALWLTAILGWLMTGFAVSLGSPFWFDVLNKFIVIRSTVKPHEKSPEEESEDRQWPGSRSRQAGDADGKRTPSTPGGGGNTGVTDYRQLENELPDHPAVGL